MILDSTELSNLERTRSFRTLIEIVKKAPSDVWILVGMTGMDASLLWNDEYSDSWSCHFCFSNEIDDVVLQVSISSS